MKTRQEKLKKLFSYEKENTAIRNCNGEIELTTAVKKHFSRKNNKDLSTKSFYRSLVKNRLKTIAEALPDDEMSMGSKYTVNFAGVFGISDLRKEYAKSCSYTAKHHEYLITIDLQTLVNMQVVGGLATYIYPGQKSRVKKCWWYSGAGKKGNFTIEKKEGFLYAGFHHTDKKWAIAGGERNIIAQKEAERREKEEIKIKTQWDKDYKKALKRQYSFNDSLKSGNCEAGTRAFILRCRLNSEMKYRGGFLLKTATEKSVYSLPYVKKMIEYFAKNN